MPLDLTMNQHQFNALRKILLSILYHGPVRDASSSYVREHLAIAGATPDEIAKLMGDK
jgi:hypothetical protein